MKCLWGSVPAFDVLNLRSSEGLDYNEDMNVCFASNWPSSIASSILH